jgi:hypothetical protein
MIAWFEWQSTQLESVACTLSALAPKKATISMALAVLTLFTVEPPFILYVFEQAEDLWMLSGMPAHPIKS